MYDVLRMERPGFLLCVVSDRLSPGFWGISLCGHSDLPHVTQLLAAGGRACKSNTRRKEGGMMGFWVQI